jgi:glycerol-3-phosphate dehydrogenase
LNELRCEQPELAAPLHPSLPIGGAEVVWAARHEMARTVDDVLARRTGALSLDAKASVAMAPAVAQLLAAELGRDALWQRRQIADFTAIASGYMVNH